MQLIKSLNWRYATKKFSDRKISDTQLDTIIEAIQLSASSAGMQPYRLLVVENKDLRKELGEGSFNTQIAEASHLLVFAAYTRITRERINEYLDRIALQRGATAESLAPFRQSLETYLLARTDEENFQWSARQAYIALGTGIVAAAELEVDATPMEGFDGAKFDKLLGLEEKGLKSVVLLALGYRDEEQDVFAKLKKVRIPREEFVTEVLRVSA